MAHNCPSPHHTFDAPGLGRAWEHMGFTDEDLEAHAKTLAEEDRHNWSTLPLEGDRSRTTFRLKAAEHITKLISARVQSGRFGEWRREA